MSEEATNNEVYEKLTPQRKFIYDKLVSFFEKGADWRQGWSSLEAPVNAATGTRYKGNNFMSLIITAMDRGYTDNRWLTYKQMKDKDWDFKTDAEGNSLGRGAGVTIEYYTLFDKEEQKPFDRSVLIGMDEDERHDYLKNNVRVMRKFYRVFNGDIIDGIPEKKPKEHDESGYNKRAENIIAQWSETESPIVYGGRSAFYRRPTDTIHLPVRDDFVDLQEFYSTALHEIGHSTGHEKRLNRPHSKFGSAEYAEEELRAELASVFLEQDLGVSVEDNHLENNSAYIKMWLSAIKSDPNVLFKAIADADKIAGYVMQKEPLKAMSIEEAEKDAGEDNSERERRLAEIREKPSEEYILPSEIAAKAMPRSSPVDMSARGIDSLKRLDDRAVVEKAMDGKYGTSFSTLYSGGALVGDETLDESSLLKRLAVYTSDKEQLLRILKSSGQYRDEKPNSHYERLIKNALDEVSQMRQGNELQPAISPVKKGHVGANAK